MNDKGIEMGKDIVKLITKNGSKISKLEIPSANVLDFFNKLSSAYSEKQVTEREIKKIESQERLLRLEITKKYDFYFHLCEHIFAERKVAIVKSFEIIDHGISEKNNDLIAAGLKSLSQIVSSSPFANIDNLRKLLESDKIVDI